MKIARICLIPFLLTLAGLQASVLGGSFNGRTPTSKVGNGGSTPPPPALILTPLPAITPVSPSKKPINAAFLRSQNVTSQKMESSAYCLKGKMANGNRTHDGAAASNRYPLGTKLRITSGELAGKRVTVTDRHSKKYGNLVDVYMASCADANLYGRKPVTVRVDK